MDSLKRRVPWPVVLPPDYTFISEEEKSEQTKFWKKSHTSLCKLMHFCFGYFCFVKFVFLLRMPFGAMIMVPSWSLPTEPMFMYRYSDELFITMIFNFACLFRDCNMLFFFRMLQVFSLCQPCLRFIIFSNKSYLLI